MDKDELGRRLENLSGELATAHQALRTGFPNDSDWVDREMAGLQYRLAVVRDSLERHHYAGTA